MTNLFLMIIASFCMSLPMIAIKINEMKEDKVIDLSRVSIRRFLH